MLAAVDFDDQLGAVTDKVDNVVTKTYLPPKMRGGLRDPITEVPPKFSLGLGRI